MAKKEKQNSENLSSTATIEEKMDYHFRDKKLLERALTRKAHALELKQRNQDCEDQEVFRTLGDAVLKAILVDLLIANGAKTREEITGRKKDFEREEALAKFCQELEIAPFIKLGVGEEKQNARKEPKVLAETLEALIGAIYLDGDYGAAKEVISKWYRSHFTLKP